MAINTFALLDDEEGEDISTLADNIYAKALSRLPSVDSVSATKRGQGRRGRGRGSGSNAPNGEGGRGRGSGSNAPNGEGGRGRGSALNGEGRSRSWGNTDLNREYMQHSVSSHVDGHRNDNESKNKYIDGYQRSRGSNGYQNDKGGYNIYRKKSGFGTSSNQRNNKADSNRNGINDKRHGKPALKENHESGYMKQVEVNSDGGWEHVSRFHSKTYGRESQFFRNRNGNWSLRGYNGGNNGFRNKSETEESDQTKNSNHVNGDKSNGGPEGHVTSATEASEDAELQRKLAEERRKAAEERRKAAEEENKKMTLEQYEKQLLAKRPAVQKAEERRVVVDKELESMQRVEKKKVHDLSIKLKNDDDKLRKNNGEKEEKIHKAMSIDEFLGQRRRRRRRYRSQEEIQEDSASAEAPPSPAPHPSPAPPCIKDPTQFPVLGGSVKV